MDLRKAILAVAVSLTLPACEITPKPDPTCGNTLGNAKGSGVDKADFSFADGCADVEDVYRRGFRVNFPKGGPITTIGISGRNLEDLDLDKVGDYKCDSYLMKLRATASPSDDGNPAYDNGGYDSINQNTAVEGDCLYGACTVSVTSPASSGTVKLHFTGHLSRGKAGFVPPFRCDYMDFGFDLTLKTPDPLRE